MNTPDSKLHDDSHTHHSLIVRSESQFNKNRIQRTQARDYGRILRENKVPPLWYRTPGPPCSIYFYDPHYQRHIRERSNDWIPATPIRTKVVDSSIFLFDLKNFLFYISSLDEHAIIKTAATFGKSKENILCSFTKITTRNYDRSTSLCWYYESTDSKWSFNSFARQADTTTY